MIRVDCKIDDHDEMKRRLDYIEQALAKARTADQQNWDRLIAALLYPEEAKKLLKKRSTTRQPSKPRE